VVRLRSRHAAALALVGWYLIMPPRVNNELRPEMPLTDWVQLGVFDSDGECRKAGYDRQDEMKTSESNQGRVPQYQPWICVASDDPRLKAK
jgi:hypothetical protein